MVLRASRSVVLVSKSGLASNNKIIDPLAAIAHLLFEQRIPLFEKPMKAFHRCFGGNIILLHVEEHTFSNENARSRPYTKVVSIIASSSVEFFFDANYEGADILEVFIDAEGEELCFHPRNVRPREVLSEFVASVLLEILKTFIRL